MLLSPARPTCACGCGQPVNTGARYVRGHNRRGVPAPQNASHAGYLRRFVLGHLLNGPATTTEILAALPPERLYNRHIVRYALTTLERTGHVYRSRPGTSQTSTEWSLTDDPDHT